MSNFTFLRITIYFGIICTFLIAVFMYSFSSIYRNSISDNDYKNISLITKSQLQFIFAPIHAFYITISIVFFAVILEIIIAIIRYNMLKIMIILHNFSNKLEG